MRVPVIFLVLSCGILVECFGQDDPVALANQYLEQADVIYSQQKEAILIAKDLYVQAADLDPTNVRANWLAGKLYLETINKDKAVDYLLRVQELKPKYRFDILYQIGRAYHYGLDFDTALDYYHRYKKKVVASRSYRGKDRVRVAIVDRRILECNNGKDIIDQPAQYSIEPLSEAINSEWPDYAPVLNRDETVMIFTSRRQEGNTSPDVDRDNFYFEDVFISRKVNGEWKPAENIGKPINTKYHDSNIALSADGNKLYLYKDLNKGDVYYSEYDGAEWSEPKFLTNKINSSIYSENSVSETSADEVLLYTSDRPGGAGGIDIYMCIKDKKGKWYKSKSLGSVINTKYDEDSPFLAYDGKTLYFSSSGHKGYGGYDIFKSVYDSARMEWSEPENLGYPVNTPDDEIYYHASEDQRTGYYASVREGGIGFTDIFKTKFYGQTGLKVGDLIAKRRQEKLEEASEAQVASNEQKQVFEDHELKLIDHAHRIYFNADQSSIKDEHMAELDSVIQLLDKYQELSINIAGFASKDGNPRYNLDLSNKRALIVLNYLVRNGLPEERIVARGFGSVKEEDGPPEQHRRADVTIVGYEQEE